MAWQDTGSAIMTSIGTASRQIIGDLSSVVTAHGKVNFSAQASSVRDFEGASARMAVSMGRDLEQVRKSLEATGAAIGRRPAEVTAWTSEVAALTYNFEGARDAQKGLAGLAAETGRSVDDYKGLAVELAVIGKVGGDTADVIGVITAQAKKLGVQGGVAAFADQIEALSDTIPQFSTKSTADFEKVTALAGVLGKGLNQHTAERVQQQAMGTIAADPMRWERYLGRNLMDEHGQIPAADLPKIMHDIVEKTKHGFGSRAKRVLQQNFGPEAGAAIFNADYSDVDKAAVLPASKKSAQALKDYQATDAGKRDSAAVALLSRAAARSWDHQRSLEGQPMPFSSSHPNTPSRRLRQRPQQVSGPGRSQLE